MYVNQQILIAGIGITAIGALNALRNHQGITRIVLGGYLLIAFLSLFDLIPGASPLAGAIAMVALVVALLTEGLPILQSANILVANPQTSAGGGSSHTVK